MYSVTIDQENITNKVDGEVIVMERKIAWLDYMEEDKLQLEILSKNYREFLDNGKTERECIKQSVAFAKQAGYRDLGQCIKDKTQLKAGDKVYAVNMDKAIVLFNICLLYTSRCV